MSTADPFIDPFAVHTDAAGAFDLINGGARFLAGAALGATARAEQHAAIVSCEGVPVARLLRASAEAAYDLAQIACTGTTHGWHPRWAETLRRLSALRERLGEMQSSEACPDCDGGGWLAPASAQACQQRAIANVLGVWRGIVRPPGAPEPTREETMLALSALAQSPQVLRVVRAPDSAEEEHMETGQAIRLVVRCSEEQCEIGALVLPAGQRVVLTMDEVRRRVEAAEPRFGLEKAALRDGELWSCPHCRRPVTVRGVLGKGLPLDATVVLGSVTVQG